MSEHHIKSIRIQRLFGRYSYQIPSPQGALDDLNIIYGINGLGKTTLLSLVFQLLMIDKFKVYADSISKMAFESLVVTLKDDTEIAAIKNDQLLVGAVLFSIKKSDGHSIKWYYVPGQQASIAIADLPANINIASLPDSMRAQVEELYRQKEFLSALGGLQAAVYMLTSDRMLLGDPTSTDRENRISQDRARLRVPELVAIYRNEAIIDSLKATSRWLQDKFLDSSYRATGARNVYEEVITKIASSTYRTRQGLGKVAVEAIKIDLLSQIGVLNLDSKEYFKLGMGDTGVSQSLADTVETCSGNRLVLVQEVLGPYLAELRNRQIRIEQPYKLVKRFMTAANRFFKDKELTFNILTGLKIFVTKQGVLTESEITPEQLSSGEKQLIFILCRVLTAAGSTSIFIIDEPEISLNILWQRMLVSTLTELAEGGGLQFILASHSMEIIAQHNDRVLILEEEV